MWSTFIALEQNDEVVAGFVNFPALGELVTAARGAGARINGEPIRVSAATEVSQSVLSLDSFNQIGRYPWAGRLGEFMRPFWAVRCFGGCYDAVLVARGMAEIWIETSGQPWDFAALKIVAEEAGARYFSFAGRSTIHDGNAVICAPGLERVAREFLGLPLDPPE